MTEKPNHEPDNPQQSERFIDTAKDLETDETGAAFERTFGVVVKNLPKRVICRRLQVPFALFGRGSRLRFCPSPDA